MLFAAAVTQLWHMKGVTSARQRKIPFKSLGELNRGMWKV